MTIIAESIWPLVAQVVGFENDGNLIAMHFSEIEGETLNRDSVQSSLRATGRAP